MSDNKYTGASDISLRVAGEALKPEDGYNLATVIEALKNAEDLIQKAYLVANHRSRFTEKDSEQVQIKLKKLRRGSLISELSVHLSDVVLPALPFLVDNREFIWEIIKTSLEFLRIKLKTENEDNQVKVVEDNQTSSIKVVAKGKAKVTINVQQGVPELANGMQPVLSELANQIDGEKVKTIELFSDDPGSNKSDNVISMDYTDHELFTHATFTSTLQVEVLGKITSGNFDTNSGKIQILKSASQDIQPGKSYKLRINPELHAEEKWREMFLKTKPYFCKYTLGGPDRNIVTEIIITDWDENNWYKEVI